MKRRKERGGQNENRRKCWVIIWIEKMRERKKERSTQKKKTGHGPIAIFEFPFGWMNLKTNIAKLKRRL